MKDEGHLILHPSSFILHSSFFILRASHIKVSHAMKLRPFGHRFWLGVVEHAETMGDTRIEALAW
jgi:hypothetical protein